MSFIDNIQKISKRQTVVKIPEIEIKYIKPSHDHENLDNIQKHFEFQNVADICSEITLSKNQNLNLEQLQSKIYKQIFNETTETTKREKDIYQELADLKAQNILNESKILNKESKNQKLIQLCIDQEKMIKNQDEQNQLLIEQNKLNDQKIEWIKDSFKFSGQIYESLQVILNQEQNQQNNKQEVIQEKMLNNMRNQLKRSRTLAPQRSSISIKKQDIIHMQRASTKNLGLNKESD